MTNFRSCLQVFFFFFFPFWRTGLSLGVPKWWCSSKLRVIYFSPKLLACEATLLLLHNSWDKVESPPTALRAEVFVKNGWKDVCKWMWSYYRHCCFNPSFYLAFFFLLHPITLTHVLCLMSLTLLFSIFVWKSKMSSEYIIEKRRIKAAKNFCKIQLSGWKQVWLFIKTNPAIIEDDQKIISSVSEVC